MFCNLCGNKINKNMAFCENCGNKLTSKIDKNIDNSNLVEFYNLKEQIENINMMLSTLPQKTAVLNRLRQELQNKLRDLQPIRNVMLKEKKDFDDLLKFGYTSIKAKLSGNIDSKKRKEEIEYLNALMEFQEAEKEYIELSDEIKALEIDISRIRETEKQIPILKSNIDSLLEILTKNKRTDRLESLEFQYVKVQNQLSQSQSIESKFSDARNLLIKTESDLDRALNELRSARSLGNWDAFFGGGYWTDASKHDQLNRAREYINSAEYNIRRARSLIADISVINIHFEAPSFFTDVFFDNFFMDMYGNAKISRTQERVRTALYQVKDATNGLNPKLNYWKDQRMLYISNINNLKKQINDERKSILGL